MSLWAAFADQAASNDSLGSPFTARVLRLLANGAVPEGRVRVRLEAFRGDLGPYGQSVPLRLLGGLHALVLSGTDQGLAAVYPPAPAPDEARLTAAIQAAIAAHPETLLEWLTHPPQTNEVRRSGALIAGASLLAAKFGLPFTLSELGASGGLNLMFDRFALDTGQGLSGSPAPALTLAPNWRGPGLPLATIAVAERRGVDLNPLDARDDRDALRLMSYLWADQPDRIALSRAAIAVAGAQVDKGDAADWLESRLQRATGGTCHLVYHTIAWQYFPPPVQQRCRIALEQAGARATAQAPLAHLAVEADGGEGAGAAITLTTWPGGRRETLGRIDFHGRWIDWQAGSLGFT